MICQKCGCRHMVDDSQHEIKVLRCFVCGDRIYLDHPKRSGAFVCWRCGSEMAEKNPLGLCNDCLRLLGLHTERLKARNYGQTTCACGMAFTRTSPTQLFHSKECRKRVVYQV
jgi:hypothetical protein